MLFWHILLLAAVQGLTEFLPISSSGHLILFRLFEGWRDPGLAFDVAVHIGTLGAVIGYFRHELAIMARDWGQSLVRRRRVGDSTLAWAVLWATVPVGLAGLVLSDWIEHQLRDPSVAGLVVATTTLVFGGLLGWADRFGRRQRSEHSVRWWDVVWVGLAQVLALIPGTSRSGITMTAGLFLGLTREGTARFSFLLAIPVLVLAGGHQAYQVAQSGADAAAWGDLALGVLLAGGFAYLCIHYFLRFLERVGMMPFVLYRLILGAFLLAWFVPPVLG